MSGVPSWLLAHRGRSEQLEVSRGQPPVVKMTEVPTADFERLVDEHARYQEALLKIAGGAEVNVAREALGDFSTHGELLDRIDELQQLVETLTAALEEKEK